MRTPFSTSSVGQLRLVRLLSVAPLALGVCVVASTVACGPSEPPKDPTSEEAKPADDTPKWEGASTPQEQPKSKSAGSSVNEAPARRADQYDKEATEVVLKRSARQVKENCGAAKDDSGKAVGPWGKTSVQVQLGHNGHSKGVTVPSPYQGKPVGNCIEKAFTNLTFPPWGGSDTTIDWEVELLAPDEKPAGKKP